MSRFDVWWVSLDPTKGAEIRKSRPCVIISPDEMDRLKTVIVAPMTSTVRPYPWRISVKFKGRDGSVALDQIRVVDKTRLGECAGKLGKAEGERILSVLGEMFSP